MTNGPGRGDESSRHSFRRWMLALAAAFAVLLTVEFVSDGGFLGSGVVLVLCCAGAPSALLLARIAEHHRR